MKHIQIGCHTYTIEFDDNIFWEHENAGYHQRDLCKITIAKARYTPEFQCNTFWHEILHAINFSWQQGLDEAGVNRLAEGISQVMQQLIEPEELLNMIGGDDE